MYLIVLVGVLGALLIKARAPADMECDVNGVLDLVCSRFVLAHLTHRQEAAITRMVQCLRRYPALAAEGPEAAGASSDRAATVTASVRPGCR